MGGESSKPVAVIIGAGPAGLTAALELIRRTDIRPVVVEAEDINGGISQTREYKGNRIDIGGHRFFSKSDRVMDWWREIMPVDPMAGQGDLEIRYQNKSPDSELSGKSTPQSPSTRMRYSWYAAGPRASTTAGSSTITPSVSACARCAIWVLHAHDARIGFSYLARNRAADS